VRLRIPLGAADLSRTRFAISPVYETVMALAVLRRPGVHAVHLPWATWARPRVRDIDGLPMLLALTARDDLKPSFLMPPPDARLPDLDAELRRVRATPAARARDDVARLHSHAVAEFAAAPRRWLPQVSHALRECFERIIAPHWERIARVLEADIAHRAGLLAEHGFGGLFAGLHPEIVWSDGELVVHPQRMDEARVALRGHGLILCPSAFCWPRVTAGVRPVAAGTLRYPARGVATLWESIEPTPAALAGLIGRTRAAILTHLARPHTTTDLADALGVTAGAVSQHLTVLREAGLVATHRDGRTDR
jgi:biotin operon repressor